MCGIAGLFSGSAPPPADELARRAEAMVASLRHRGPDDGGVWVDADAGLAFGFRRLAIVDLSAAGAQPMLSASARTAIAYNGEIYNAEAIRTRLAGAVPAWRGHSDTEVLVEAIEHWGIERAITEAAGMFAIACFERGPRRLHLVRDRLGKKPLYWTQTGETIAFASELRALRLLPGFSPALDRDAIALYLRHGCFPAPHTIYREVRQLLPGYRLTVEPGRPPAIVPYWSLPAVVSQGAATPFTGSEDQAVDALEALLGEAVGERMVADVPLGALLSGGIDSSLVVALMQRRASRPVRTFSIGYEDSGFDESTHAAAVARHLGTDHTEMRVGAADALAVVPRLPEIYDEPFADASAIPTALVCALARRNVTVALTGDGGDEVFAGYNRYLQGRRFERLSAQLPRGLRGLAAVGIRGLAPSTWDRLATAVPSRYRPRLAGDKLYKLADVATADGDGYYRALTSYWPDPERLVPGAREPGTAASDPSLARDVPDFVERMQVRDALTYLPNDILVKVDRASMAVALEARAPLLDHRVVEFAWRLPLAMKIQNGRGKQILRRVLHRHVPPALVERPKMGFGVPIDAWLRGPMRDWAEDLLAERSLRDGGLLDPAPIRARWAEHLAGRRSYEYSLWTVLMLEAWRRRWA
jgi:asparagine synthase (glutamine-hydrolysing)